MNYEYTIAFEVNGKYYGGSQRLSTIEPNFAYEITYTSFLYLLVYTADSDVCYVCFVATPIFNQAPKNPLSLDPDLFIKHHVKAVGVRVMSILISLVKFFQIRLRVSLKNTKRPKLEATHNQTKSRLTKIRGARIRRLLGQKLDDAPINGVDKFQSPNYEKGI